MADAAPARPPARAQPTADLDPFAVDRLHDPYPAFAALRDVGPVVWCVPRSCWLVVGYDEVRAGLADTGRLSSRHGIGQRRIDQVMRRSLLTVDPPEHAGLREVVGRVFRASVLADLEPEVVAICRRLLGAALERPSFDLVADYAGPLPALVIGAMLGMSEEEVELLRPYVDAGATTIDVAELEDAREISLQQVIENLDRVFADLLERGRGGGATPAVAALVDALDAGELSLEMALEFCALLFGAGSETTVKLIGNATLCLLEQGGLEPLRRDPSLAPAIVEEALRLHPPLQAVFRTAVEPVAIGGAEIAAGDRVGLVIAAANRDPRRFPEPDAFDVGRTPNPHLSFAHGVHHCLGSALARLEGRIALQELAAAAPDLRRASPGAARYGPGRTLRGLTSLPVAAAHATAGRMQDA